MMTSLRPVKDIGSSTCVPYISLPTVITNGTKQHLPSWLERQYNSKKLRRRLKLASGLAILHRGVLIAKSLLRDLGSTSGPYCTNCQSGRFSQIQSHSPLQNRMLQHGTNISKSEIIIKWSVFPGTVTYVYCAAFTSAYIHVYV